MNQTPFNYDQLIMLINRLFSGIGNNKSINNEPSRVPSILRDCFYLIQAKKQLILLLNNKQLSPTQIVGLDEINKRNKRISEEIKKSITDKEFSNSMEIYRVCGNSKKINKKIWSKFNSELDIDTVIEVSESLSIFRKSLYFDKDIRNALLVLRKMRINMLYQAADNIVNSPSTQAPDSFIDKINAMKVKAILEKLNDVVNELLGDADINKSVELIELELRNSIYKSI